MKEKEIKKQVKLLAKQKKFEQIYYEYGPKYFRKYVSRKYKNKDIQKLRQEGKYLDIFTKYGETYNTIYDEMSIKDMENELGRKTTLPARVLNKNFLIRKKYLLRTAIIGLTAPFLTGILGYSIARDMNISENSKKYAKEIKEYEGKVKEYSKKFDKDSQSDMKIVMTMMKDMHETIRGYGEPKIDAQGYYGMDVMDENGVGVCRNMVENMVDKFNEINSNYNARLIELHMNASDLKENKIEKNTIDGNIRINTKGNMNTIYENEQIQKTIISESDSINEYQYDNGKIIKKIIYKPNQEEEIDYDEYGNILQTKKTIEKVDGDNEIEKIFVNGRLEQKREENENHYINTKYDEKGQVSFCTVADKEKKKTTFYDINGKIRSISIIQEGYETKIHYDEKGQEIERTKEKTDETNIFLKLQNGKALAEAINKIEEKATKYEEMKDKFRGNHAIVAIDSTEDNVTLLIDPTNLSLGIYKDGKIIMFNERQRDKAIYDRKIIGEISLQGTKKIIEYPLDYIKSFREPELKMEELEEKYGVEAQNRMLEEIERAESKEKAQSKFKEELKIDKGITYNYDTNVVTIDNTERLEDNTKEH